MSLFRDPAYETELRTAFRNAAGILAVNPLIAAECKSHAAAVHVIPSGFDTRRFEDLPPFPGEHRPFRFLFAGLPHEYMKGFHVLFDACSRLWRQRQDFELHVTADAGDLNAPFLRCHGWQSQTTLPKLMAQCHAVVVPTIAQEALGRTAVEGMGVGRPVIASRLGGLPFVIEHGVNGLLTSPGNVSELTRYMVRLIEDPEEAATFGRNGRENFLRDFAWESIIENKYRPLFASVGVHQ